MTRQMDPIRIAVGNRIMKARESAGLPLTALAAELGVTASAISQWERGYTTPSEANIVRLCELLEESREWIIYGRRAEESIVRAMDSVDLEIRKRLAQMSFDQKFEVMLLIKKLARDETLSSKTSGKAGRHAQHDIDAQILDRVRGMAFLQKFDVIKLVIKLTEKEMDKAQKQKSSSTIRQPLPPQSNC